MKTAMQEVLYLVEQMFANAKTQEVESAMNDVINIINQEWILKEKEQIMKAVQDAYDSTYNSCESGCGGNMEIDFTPQEYYNQVYNQNK